MNRVKQAAVDAGLDITITVLPDSAHTAAAAAQALECNVAQIVKSLIFEGADSGTLVLVMVSGAHDLDLTRAAELTGEALLRADPKRIRTQTGFAIGGVAPIGHLCAMPVFMDDALMQYACVWAAAGAPETVFEVAPKDLATVTGATLFINS
ncbi:MAG: YbaK/EbsC family protein [Sulfitobacter sp.]